MWPPVTEQQSMRRARISLASWGSCSRLRRLRSAGLWMESSKCMCPVSAIGYQLSARSAADRRPTPRDGLAGMPPGFQPGTVHPQHAHVGGLGQLPVAAGGLAELVAGGGGVEHVVRDLEGESDLLAEAAERVEHRRAGTRGAAAEHA